MRIVRLLFPDGRIIYIRFKGYYLSPATWRDTPKICAKLQKENQFYAVSLRTY